jgi:hypothetical protein
VLLNFIGVEVQCCELLRIDVIHLDFIPVCVAVLCCSVR